ncbi:MAG: hypothetical protein KBT57_09860 [bacterium]|nr:hypothetical protein [Candidatus Limimorpha equi]
MSRKKKNFLFLRIGKGEKTLNIELINMKSQSDNNRIPNKRIIAAFFLLLCIFACVSPSEGQGVLEYDTIEGLRPCQVIDIKKTNNKENGTRAAYLVCVQDTINKRYYTFVSFKDKKNREGSKIKKGKVYDFAIDVYYKFDRYMSPGRKMQIKIGDKIVFVPEDFCTLVPATTPNLKGLRYIPSEQGKH